MMIGYRDSLIICSLILTMGWMYISHEQQMTNVSGFCIERDRALTSHEKITKVQQQLAEKFSTDYSDPPSQKNHYYLYRIFQRQINSGVIDEPEGVRLNPQQLKFSLSLNENGDLLKTYIFPEYPAYAGTGAGNHRRYSAYDRGTSWSPVPIKYKRTGYAFDLIMTEVNVKAVGDDGMRYDFRIDYRAWIDACGRMVEIPNEYRIG